jgi:large subunit ribosomal protein L6
VHPLIKVASQDGNLVVSRPDDEKQSKALHGLTRSLLANMIQGVTEGYKKTLEIQGVGYKAEQKGKNIVLSVGYANQITKPIPANVTVQLEGANKIHISGADKQAVGQFAAESAASPQARALQGQGHPLRRRQVKIKPARRSPALERSK